MCSQFIQRYYHSQRLPETQFYSWYIYPDSDKDIGKSISSAEYVEDVNSDAVVIIDGLTKVCFGNIHLLCMWLTSPITCRTGAFRVGVSAGFSGPRTSSPHFHNRDHSLMVVRIIRKFLPPSSAVTPVKPSYSMQLAALPLLEPGRVREEKVR